MRVYASGCNCESTESREIIKGNFIEVLLFMGPVNSAVVRPFEEGPKLRRLRFLV
jgi:hypothetical protein